MAVTVKCNVPRRTMIGHSYQIWLEEPDRRRKMRKGSFDVARRQTSTRQVHDVIALVGEKLALESETVLNMAQIGQLCLHSLLAALGEDELELTFKQCASVLEVPFGVGFGDGDAVKRFVEDADDPPLLGSERKWDDEGSKLGRIEAAVRAAR